MDDREMYNALTDEEQKIIIKIMKMMLDGIDLDGILKRLRFIKTFYEIEIINRLDQRNTLEAKKDIKALEIAIELLERSNKSAGSKEVCT